MKNKKMKFNSGYRTFDNQVKKIEKGEVKNNTQISKIINKKNKKIKSILKEFGEIDEDVLKAINFLIKDDNIILYQFRHQDLKQNNIIIDGYLITNDKHEFLTSIVVGENENKSYLVLKEAVKHICK